MEPLPPPPVAAATSADGRVHVPLIGPAHWLSAGHESGGVVTSKFDEFVANEQKVAANILKQQRLWTDEAEAERRKEGQHGETSGGGDGGGGRAAAKRKPRQEPK